MILINKKVIEFQELKKILLIFAGCYPQTMAAISTKKRFCGKDDVIGSSLHRRGESSHFLLCKFLIKESSITIFYFLFF